MYDWDNDTEWEISEEILSELPMGKKGESRKVWAIEANMSPFGSKIYYTKYNCWNISNDSYVV